MSNRVPPDPETAERPACLHCKVPIYLDAEDVWCRKATGAAVCPRNPARDGHEPRPPATPPDVREVASLVEGEVWGWLNRADAPWSPSDKTVMDLTFAVARALAAAGVLTSTPLPEGETRVEWGVRGVKYEPDPTNVWEYGSETVTRSVQRNFRYGGTVVSRTVRSFPDVVSEWVPVEQDGDDHG